MVCVTHEPGEYSITLNDVENVVGTPDRDSLEGDGGENTLNGLGGDDMLAHSSEWF